MDVNDSNLLRTENEVIDTLLSGGFEKDILNTIYGSSASGKTNFCMIATIAVSRTGKKVIYIDSEGSFSPARFKQLCSEKDDASEVIKNIFFLRPSSFLEQKKAFNKLKEIITDKIGLVIVDSIAMLYRAELGKGNETYDINKIYEKQTGYTQEQIKSEQNKITSKGINRDMNRELGHQISFLAELTRKKKIPVIITTQVYSSFDGTEAVKMVGGDILKNWSKCIIKLEKLHNGMRIAELEKHRSIPEGKKIGFRIIEEGIIKIPEEL